MIVHIVGNRPQFIKLAPLWHELENRRHIQCIIHSGQHYDKNMSDVFFQELRIPKPEINLKIGSGTHAEITASAMLGLEKALREIAPDLVILYGDTDTTLAGALVSSKLTIPVAHVEGGARTNHKENPEECNRIVTDHLSDVIFCPDQISLAYAKKEGLHNMAFLTGDIMYDIYLTISNQLIGNAKKDEIILLTWHRQENTDDQVRMESIIRLLEKLEGEIIFPMHPRTEKALKKFDLWAELNRNRHIQIIEPVGYIEMVSLLQRAKLVVTDSGGLSKESSFAGAKCLFMIDLDVWDDLMRVGWIQKVNPQSKASVEDALIFAHNARKVNEKDRPQFYGDGHAAEKMVDYLEKGNWI